MLRLLLVKMWRSEQRNDISGSGSLRFLDTWQLWKCLNSHLSVVGCSIGGAAHKFRCIHNEITSHILLCILYIQQWSTLPLFYSCTLRAFLLAHSPTHKVSSMFLPDDSHFRCLLSRIPLLHYYCTCSKCMITKTHRHRWSLMTLLLVRLKIHPCTCPMICCHHRWVKRRELYSWTYTNIITH